METYEFIQEHELVLDRFGRWPSFHDGEVHRVVLDRTRKLTNGRICPSVELFIRTYNLTSEVKADGHYKLECESIVHLLFEQVTKLTLHGFNHQNVLNELLIEQIKENEGTKDELRIELVYLHGLTGSFSAEKAAVISVVPFDKNGI